MINLDHTTGSDTKTSSAVSSFLEIFCAFFITVALLVFSAYVLSLYEIDRPPLEDLAQLFLPKWREHLSPKPEEHFIYIGLLFLLLFLTMASIFFVRNIMQERMKRLSTLFKLAMLCAALLILYPFISSPDYITTLASGINITQTIVLFGLTGIILNSRYFFSKSYKSEKSMPSGLLKLSATLFSDLFMALRKFFLTRSSSYTVVIFILCIAAFQIFSFRVAGVQSVHEDGAGAWTAHFQAVFYAVSQVTAGKTILAELPAQYGLYAEFLKPVFSIMGLSVFRFTMVLGILQLFSTYFLLIALSKQIRYRPLYIIFAIGFCFMTSLTWVLLMGYWDPLYQITPLRFVFPAFSIYIFAHVAEEPRVSNVLPLSLVAGAAIAWNLDTGITIYGALVCYLIFLFIFPKKKRSRSEIFRFISIASVAPIIVIALILGYLQLKASSPINFSDALKYHNIFYVTGFGMLPIARGFTPWQIICATYVLGIIVAQYTWIVGHRRAKWDLVFYMSIMGLGLFSYYEGRSHTWTLIAVSWPALIISFIFCDDLIRKVIANRLPYIFSALCYPVVFLGTLLTFTFINGTPVIFEKALNHWGAAFYPETSTVNENIAFIKNHMKGDNEVVIISPLQAVYHGETGAASPLKGPGSIEIVLQSDYEAMLNQLTSYNHEHVFIQLGGNKQIPKEYEFLLQMYKLIDKNESMIYLTSVSSNR